MADVEQKRQLMSFSATEQEKKESLRLGGWNCFSAETPAFLQKKLAGKTSAHPLHLYRSAT